MTHSALTPLFALLLSAPLLAHADPKADAHMEKGMEAYGQSNFKLAAQELQAAYALDPNPDLLYAIGQVYSKLERCREAVVYYERYLATNPPVQAMVDTKQAIKACNKQAPSSTPPPAEPPPAEPPPPTPPPPEPTPDPPAATVTAPPSAWYKDPVGGALVGAGVVTAVIGVVLYSTALSDLDAAEDAPSLAEYDRLVDRAGSRRTVSVLLMGGGAVLIGAGVARYMILRGDAHETQRVGLVPVDRGGLVTFGGSFF